MNLPCGIAQRFQANNFSDFEKSSQRASGRDRCEEHTRQVQNGTKKDAGRNQRPPALKEDFALTISAEQSPLVKTLHFYTDLVSRGTPGPRTRKHKFSGSRRSNGLPAVTGLPGRPSLHVNASGVPHVAPKSSSTPVRRIPHQPLAWATGHWALNSFANPLSAPNQ